MMPPMTWATMYAGFLSGETSAGDEAERHCRVQVAAGDVADGEGHGEHGEAERERDAHVADADSGTVPPALRARTAAPQPPNEARTCRSLRQWIFRKRHSDFPLLL